MELTLRKPDKVQKKQKLRNAEYYQMQPILDELYAKSRSGTVFTNLLPLICSENNIRMAYRNIRKNAGSKTPGTDGRTIRSLDTWSTQRLIGHIQSKFNWYKPQSVRRVEIPKPNGKTCPLGIPTITDRLVQQCILQILEPICEAKFHPHSFGFRPNRGCEHAIAAAYFKMQKQHLHYVVDIDIKGFFDNVNHGKSHEIRYLNGYPLLPLSAIQHRNPMNFNKSVNSYTVEGRREIHRMLEQVNIDVLRYLLENPEPGSMEFNDKCIAVYCAQKGTCAISHRPLMPDEITFCRIREQGHKDAYRNIVMIHWMYLPLLTTRESTELAAALSGKERSAVNKLRKKMGLAQI